MDIEKAEAQQMHLPLWRCIFEMHLLKKSPSRQYFLTWKKHMTQHGDITFCVNFTILDCEAIYPSVSGIFSKTECLK